MPEPSGADPSVGGFRSKFWETRLMSQVSSGKLTLCDLAGLLWVQSTVAMVLGCFGRLACPYSLNRPS